MPAPIIAAGAKLLAPLAKEMAVTAATQAVVAGVSRGVESAVSHPAKAPAEENLAAPDKANKPGARSR